VPTSLSAAQASTALPPDTSELEVALAAVEFDRIGVAVTTVSPWKSNWRPTPGDAFFRRWPPPNWQIVKD